MRMPLRLCVFCRNYASRRYVINNNCHTQFERIKHALYDIIKLSKNIGRPKFMSQGTTSSRNAGSIAFLVIGIVFIIFALLAIYNGFNMHRTAEQLVVDTVNSLLPGDYTVANIPPDMTPQELSDLMSLAESVVKFFATAIIIVGIIVAAASAGYIVFFTLSQQKLDNKRGLVLLCTIMLCIFAFPLGLFSLIAHNKSKSRAV
jgi:tetrahydromethanopterin S-methyltransferase subunit F